MADYRNGIRAQTGTRTGVAVDQGLRSYMLGVYNYMALGVAVTALITLAVAASPAALAMTYSLRWVFFLLERGRHGDEFRE